MLFAGEFGCGSAARSGETFVGERASQPREQGSPFCWRRGSTDTDVDWQRVCFFISWPGDATEIVQRCQSASAGVMDTALAAWQDDLALGD
jgi:hypothetical protein